MQFKNQPQQFREFLSQESPRAIVADEGTILGVNDAYCDGLQIPHSGVVGRQLSELIVSDELALVACPVETIKEADLDGPAQYFVDRASGAIGMNWTILKTDDFGHLFCDVEFVEPLRLELSRSESEPS